MLYEVITCAKVEAEILELPEEDRPLFLQELGLEEPGLHRFIRSAYQQLNMTSKVPNYNIGNRSPAGLFSPEGVRDHQDRWVTATVIHSFQVVPCKSVGSQKMTESKIITVEYPVACQSQSITHFHVFRSVV